MIDNECHEEVERDGRLEPCNRPPVSYRMHEGEPYPVCRKHHRPPYWMGARSEYLLVNELVRYIEDENDIQPAVFVKQAIRRRVSRWRALDLRSQDSQPQPGGIPDLTEQEADDFWKALHPESSGLGSEK